MASLDGFTVEAASSAVVSAYHEAADLFFQCRKKRIDSNWPGPSKLLEDSLRHGPEAIQAQMRLGTDRFGTDFLKGDAVATNELTRIAMDIQVNILKPLYFAIEDESYSIGSAATDSSDNNRIKSIVALGELCQRLAKREAVVESSPAVRSRPPESSNTSFPIAVAPNSSRRMSAMAPELLARRFSSIGQTTYTPPADNRRMSEMAPEVVIVPSPQPSYPRSNSAKKSPTLEDTSPSYLPQLTWFRRKSKSEKGTGMMSPAAGESPGSSTYYTQPRRSSRSERPASESFRVYVAQTSNFPRTSSGPCDAIPEGDTLRDDTQGAGSDPTRTWTRGTAGSIPTHLSTSSGQQTRSVLSSSPLLRVPRADNHYLGFCKGAADLQRGDENAFNEEQEWAFGKVPFLMCSQCAFTGRISYTKVWETFGIRFRWAFLAKSHVSQKKVSGNVHTYICMFCVFQGLEATVIQGNDTFLNHIAEHRADDFTDILLERTRCINFREATDDEDFDINIIPLTEHEAGYRKQSMVVSEPRKTPPPKSIPLVEAPTQSPVEVPIGPMDHQDSETSEGVPWPFFR